MVVPVVFGKSSFDYAPLRSEQSRLSKMLVLPSPRDKDDTSKTLEVEDSQTPPSKYPTFIKVTYGKEGSLPVYELWMKDNNDNEFNLSGATGSIGTRPVAAANGWEINNPADTTVDASANEVTVPRDFTVSPITGEIRVGARFAGLNGAAGTYDGITYATAGTVVGTIKFDGVTGLALASINNRIADVSNAVEAVTKVLSVTTGNLDNVLNIIR